MGARVVVGATFRVSASFSNPNLYICRCYVFVFICDVCRASLSFAKTMQMCELSITHNDREVKRKAIVPRLAKDSRG